VAFQLRDEPADRRLTVDELWSAFSPTRGEPPTSSTLSCATSASGRELRSGGAGDALDHRRHGRLGAPRMFMGGVELSSYFPGKTIPVRPEPLDGEYCEETST
jgi:hypothetical protein